MAVDKPFRFGASGTPDGTKDLATITAEALDQQLGWVRAAAGARFGELELQTLVYAVAVTEDRGRTTKDDRR